MKIPHLTLWQRSWAKCKYRGKNEKKHRLQKRRQYEQGQQREQERSNRLAVTGKEKPCYRSNNRMLLRKAIREYNKLGCKSYWFNRYLQLGKQQ